MKAQVAIETSRQLKVLGRNECHQVENLAGDNVQVRHISSTSTVCARLVVFHHLPFLAAAATAHV
jgi:hypothetical protein